MKDREKLLEDFATGFFGYGNIGAKIWFVGYEEGFPRPLPKETKAKLEQVVVRAKVWRQLGGEDVLDLKEFCSECAKHGLENFDCWFKESPPIQPTWRSLIYLLLKFNCDQGLERAEKHCNSAARKERIREYQRSCWACEDGDVCLLEMYGLPNPNQEDWIYCDLFSKEEASEKFRPKRHDWFQQKLKRYGPELVVFYKNDPLSVCHWSKICGVSEWQFQLVDKVKWTRRKLRYAKKDGTLFVCIPHSSRIGYDYLNGLATFIAREKRKTTGAAKMSDSATLN
jgi:hypothetical protein